MFVVYVLYSNGAGKRYIGHTSNLDRRLQEHNDLTQQIKGKFTLKNGPWRVVYQENGFESRAEAMKREKYLKSGQGREFLHKTIPRD